MLKQGKNVFKSRLSVLSNNEHICVLKCTRSTTRTCTYNVDDIVVVALVTAVAVVDGNVHDIAILMMMMTMVGVGVDEDEMPKGLNKIFPINMFCYCLLLLSFYYFYSLLFCEYAK